MHLREILAAGQVHIDAEARDPVEVLSYVEHIAKELPLPTFLYNMPSHTKLVFNPKTVREAADIPGIVGLKDSSANMHYFHQVQELCRDKPEFTLIVGPEELLAETVLLGGHGGVNGGANMKPDLYVALYNAAKAVDMDKIATLHKKDVDIVLSGHTHGGQVRLPLIGAIISGCKIKTRFASGLFYFKKMVLFTSRGLGEGKYSQFRCYCPPEAVRISIYRTDQPVENF